MTQSVSRGSRLPDRHIARIGMEMVAPYLEVSGDDNAIHSDLDRARRAGLTERPVPGMLVMGMLGALVMAWPPVAAVTRLSAEFVAPAFVDGDLALSGKIVALDEHAGTAVLRLVARQANRLCAVGEAKVRLKASVECAAGG